MTLKTRRKKKPLLERIWLQLSDWPVAGAAAAAPPSHERRTSDIFFRVVRRLGFQILARKFFHIAPAQATLCLTYPRLVPRGCESCFLDADQKDRSLWERDWDKSSITWLAQAQFHIIFPPNFRDVVAQLYTLSIQGR